MASATGYAGARSAPIATGRRSAMSSFDEDAASHKHRKRPTYRRRRVTFGVQGTNGLYLAIDVGIRVAIAQLERGAAFNAIGDLQRQAGALIHCDGPRHLRPDGCDTGFRRCWRVGSYGTRPRGSEPSGSNGASRRAGRCAESGVHHGRRCGTRGILFSRLLNNANVRPVVANQFARRQVGAQRAERARVSDRYPDGPRLLAGSRRRRRLGCGPKATPRRDGSNALTPA